MNWFRFIDATSKIIERGGVVRSKFTTAGPHRMAVNDGRGNFSVYDDRDGSQHRHKTAIGAAYHWNKINIDEIS